MEKLAIIDMGSNSIRFLVLEIADNNSFSFVYQEKETIRLGLGLAKTGKLRDEGMQKALQCLTMYKHLMSVMNITTCLAVATAAVRNATNGQAFLEQIYTETQIKLDVISGEREAYLGYLGVINTIKERNFLLFDLGGASIELTLVLDGSPRQSVSLPIGAVTLMERFNSKTISPKRPYKIVKNTFAKPCPLSLGYIKLNYHSLELVALHEPLLK